MDGKYAYLTALTNENYLPGTLALIRSMKQVNIKHSLIIMIPESRYKALIEKIKQYGLLLYDNIKVSVQPDIHVEISKDLKNYYWQDTFFKIQAANLTEYEKIVLIDSDMLVRQNLDDLFMRPSKSAAIGGHFVHQDWYTLNSGLVVIEPSKILYKSLLESIKPAVTRKLSKGLNAGDQDVFQECWADWRNHPECILPEKYNVFWGWIDNYCDYYHCKPDEIAIIHFVGKDKPWNFKKSYVIRIFFSGIKRHNFNKLLFKVKSWYYYRKLCDL